MFCWHALPQFVPMHCHENFTFNGCGLSLFASALVPHLLTIDHDGDDLSTNDLAQ
jgi:hypothetical protein